MKKWGKRNVKRLYLLVLLNLLVFTGIGYIGAFATFSFPDSMKDYMMNHSFEDCLKLYTFDTLSSQYNGIQWISIILLVKYWVLTTSLAGFLYMLSSTALSAVLYVINETEKEAALNEI